MKAGVVKRHTKRSPIPKPKPLRNGAEAARKKSPLAKWICDVQILSNMGVQTWRRRSPHDGADRCSCVGREYRCKNCKRWRPWCEGGADDTGASAFCDRCWNEDAARREAP